MGLISKDLKKDIETASTIRNRFAHWAKPITFDHNDIREMCESIGLHARLFKRAMEPTPFADGYAKFHFITFVDLATGHLIAMTRDPLHPRFLDGSHPQRTSPHSNFHLSANGEGSLVQSTDPLDFRYTPGCTCDITTCVSPTSHGSLLFEEQRGDGMAYVQANAWPLFWWSVAALLFVGWPLFTLVGYQLTYQRLRTALGDGYSKAAAYAEATKGVAVDTSGLRFAFALRRRVYLCSAADILRADLIDEKQIVLTGTIETLNPDVARVVLQTVFRQRKLGSVMARLKGMVSRQSIEEYAKTSPVDDDLAASIRLLSEAVRELTAVVRLPPSARTKGKGKGA